jgi:hypothetical protein
MFGKKTTAVDELIDMVEDSIVSRIDKWVFNKKEKFWMYDNPESPLYINYKGILTMGIGHGGSLHLTEKQVKRVKTLANNLAALKAMCILLKE